MPTMDWTGLVTGWGRLACGLCTTVLLALERDNMRAETNCSCSVFSPAKRRPARNQRNQEMKKTKRCTQEGSKTQDANNARVQESRGGGGPGLQSRTPK